MMKLVGTLKRNVKLPLQKLPDRFGAKPSGPRSATPVSPPLEVRTFVQFMPFASQASWNTKLASVLGQTELSDDDWIVPNTSADTVKRPIRSERRGLNPDKTIDHGTVPLVLSRGWTAVPP